MLKKINEYAPFCHGTDYYSQKEIDDEGLLPRGTERVSQWTTETPELESLKDRVYFSSIRDGVGNCISAMENACQQSCDIELLEGVFYVLPKLPMSLLPYATYDEDVLRYNPYQLSALESLEKIGSLAIKHKVDRRLLKKFTPREFFNEYKNTNQYFKQLKTWNNFVEDYFMNRSGIEGLEWTKEHFPELLD